MAEHDSDREDREDREERDLERERREGRERAADGGPEAQDVSFDEDAAWAAIVAGYGEEPPDPPGSKPFKSVEDLALLEPEVNDEKPFGGPARLGPAAGRLRRLRARRRPPGPHARRAVRRRLRRGRRGPLACRPSRHRCPTPTLTAKFAWLGVLGGPVLLLLAVVLGWDMTWWLTTLSIGGFLGGFATLVMRMRTGDEDDDDPGRGAVV
ncbi:hypothetical protein SVIOM342S_04486 [Streptomyces violaceorubidus]